VPRDRATGRDTNPDGRDWLARIVAEDGQDAAPTAGRVVPFSALSEGQDDAGAVESLLEIRSVGAESKYMCDAD